MHLAAISCKKTERDIEDILLWSSFKMKEQKKFSSALFLKVDLPLLFVSDFEWPIFGRMEDG